MEFNFHKAREEVMKEFQEQEAKQRALRNLTLNMIEQINNLQGSLGLRAFEASRNSVLISSFDDQRKVTVVLHPDDEFEISDKNGGLTTKIVGRDEIAKEIFRRITKID